jgi:hypothetical protein
MDDTKEDDDTDSDLDDKARSQSQPKHLKTCLNVWFMADIPISVL